MCRTLETRREAIPSVTGLAPQQGCRGSARAAILGVLAFAIVLGTALWILLRAPEPPQRTKTERPAASENDLPGFGETPAQPATVDRPAPQPDGDLDPPEQADEPSGPPSIEVFVWIDGEPARGGFAEVRRTDPEGVITLATQEIRDGTTLFESLDPKRTYTVEVDLVSGSRYERSVMLGTEPASVEFQLGTGRVFGNVLDARGVPLQDAVVRIHPVGGFASAVPSPDDGSYAFEDLASGVVRVELRRVELGRDERKLEEVIVLLQAGEARRIDFGATSRTVLWAGRVQLANNLPVEFGDPEYAPAVQHALAPSHDFPAEEGRVTAGSIHTPYGLDGKFEIAIAPGTYVVSVEAPACGSEILIDDAFEVGSLDFERDLVLPGASIRGVVSGLVTPSARVVLRPAGDEYSTGRQVKLRADDSFGFDAVPAGAWKIEVTGALEPISATIDIAPDDTVRRLVLEASP